MNTRVEGMDILEVILAEVQHARKEQGEIRKDLKEHIRDENVRYGELKDEMHVINTESQLMKQKGNIVNGGIASLVATVVAGFVSWVVIVFSGHGSS